MSGKNAFVIGYPIKHSRSPLIHNYWLKEYNLTGSYTKLEIAPGDLKTFLSNMESSIYCGGNVTIPHKEKTFEICVRTTETARKIGAVNTIWLEDSQLCGDNTDVGGFLANLDEEAPGWDAPCEKAAVIGAGGAARAILVGLASRGVRHVKILNRTADRMRALADEARVWGFQSVTTHLLAEPRAFSGEALLVNATSLGMVGQPALSVDLDGLSKNAVVSDIVYAPLETALLREAARRGHRTSSGLGMLLHQAAPGFERWFGVRPKVTPALRDLIVDDLRQARP
ncbi:shikimate dehydrogenase [Rhodoblastus sp.]|uniref:shikimate dehydrogenase n=1 Tax=Rhodoblastus sp. TaxID=1962975 RepID=UPI0035B20F6F